MLRTYAFIIICSLNILGCVSSEFAAVNSPYVGPKGAFNVDIPANWRKHKLVKDSSLAITRDGLELQRILICMKSAQSSFSHTKRTANEGMMAQELAELYIDDLKSDEELLNLEIIDNNPAIVGSHDGFKFTYIFKTKDGLRKKGVAYGYRKDKLIFLLDYNAPEQVYFNKDIATFEKIKTSFHAN